MSELGEYIKTKIGGEYFAGDEELDKVEAQIPLLARNRPNRIVIGIIRETIGPFIDRSTVPDETIGFKIGDGISEKEVIEVPARKFKSKEKLYGIRLCRLYNVIDKNYRYNSLNNVEQLNNPASGIMGDTVVSGGGDNAGQGMLPARILYSNSYSIRDKSLLTERLTHNSLSYNGTMWDNEDGKNRQSLFETEYIVPGVYFPSFLTLLDPTPESLIFALSVLSQNSYGAQTSITGSNIKNNVVFLCGCHNEPAISSYTVSRDWDENESVTRENIEKYMVNNTEKCLTGSFGLLDGSELSSVIKRIHNSSFEEIKESFEQLQGDITALYQYSKFGNKKRNNSRSKGKEEIEDGEI